MVDVQFIEEQLKQLAKRSKEKARDSNWTGLDEFIYNTFTALQVQELTETVRTLQTADKMLSNLEKNLDKKDYEVLKKQQTGNHTILYIRTAAHLSLIGHGALIAVELIDHQAKLSIYEHQIPLKSIDTYDLMDYMAQTIVAPSKRSRELIVNKNIFKHIPVADEDREVQI